MFRGKLGVFSAPGSESWLSQVNFSNTIPVASDWLMSKCVTNYFPTILGAHYCQQNKTGWHSENHEDRRGLRPQWLFFLVAELTNPETTVTQTFLCGEFFLLFEAVIPKVECARPSNMGRNKILEVCLEKSFTNI